jgi:hypothetical protein
MFGDSETRAMRHLVGFGRFKSGLVGEKKYTADTSVKVLQQQRVTAGMAR